MEGVPQEGVPQGMQATANSDTDFATLLSAVLIHGSVCGGCLVAFSVLRKAFPKVYCNNALESKVDAPAAGLNAGWRRVIAATGKALSWPRQSAAITTEQAAETAGLDSALLLEFSELGFRLSAWLSLPLMLVLAPLHAAAGGGAAGSDRLGWIGMGNVRSHHSWLYYVHALFVWGVCLLVRAFLLRAQAKFLTLRFPWLLDLPAPRATTILLARIPQTCRSASHVKKFLSDIFSDDAVQEVHFVKNTGALASMVQARDRARELFREAELRAERDGVRPTHRVLPSGMQVDSMTHYEEEIESLEAPIAAERARIAEGSASASGDVNSHCAFVTFATRRHAEMARDLRFSANRNQWQVSFPPEPSAISWQALVLEPRRSALMALLGTGVIVALYLFFTPLCALITSAASTIRVGPLQPVWAALAPTIGLRLMLMFLPTILLTIFRLLFPLKSEPESQHQLQVWFFAFEFVFVILVTAISTSLVDTLQQLAHAPLSVFDLLGKKMPGATHFYMNYLVLTWSTFGIALLRIANLAKFLAFRALYTEEEARQKAEPENQDSDGMGARYAEYAVSLCICLIFSTLSPLVAPIAAVSFAVYRIIHGYLIVFAETRKPDLGGDFWVTSLAHVQVGLALYCALMIGVLAARAPNGWPATLVAPSLALVLWTYLEIRRSFDWTRVPFDELLRAQGAKAFDRALPDGEHQDQEAYTQPELRDRPERGFLPRPLASSSGSSSESESSGNDNDFDG